jgi:hypothetical protein
VTVLAASAAGNVIPGVLGFLVVAVMALALFFLLRSMNKQLHKISPGQRPKPGRAAKPGSGGTRSG